MIDYNLFVAPLEKQGYSDQKIASMLSSVTCGDILASDIENFLSDQGLAKRNPITGSWQGSLISLMEQGGDIGEGLEELFSHLNKPRSVCIETSKHPWAEKAGILLTALFIGSHISESQLNEIYEMAGGKLHPQGVTEESIASSRASHQSIETQNKRVRDIESILEEIRSRFIFPSIGSGATPDQVRESIKQGL